MPYVESLAVGRDFKTILGPFITNEANPEWTPNQVRPTELNHKMHFQISESTCNL